MSSEIIKEAEGLIADGKGDKKKIKVSGVDIMEFKNKIDSLEKKIREEKERADDLSFSLKSANSELENLKLKSSSKVNKSSSKLQTLETQLDALQKEAGLKDEKISKLEQQVQQASQQIDQYAQGIQQVQEQSGELQEELDSLREANKQLKAQVGNAQQGSPELEQKVSKLEAKIQLLQAQKQKLQGQVQSGGSSQDTDKDEKIEKMTGFIKKLQTDMQALKQENQNLKSKLQGGGGGQQSSQPKPKQSSAAQQVMGGQPQTRKAPPSRGPSGPIRRGGRVVCQACGSSKVKEVEDKTSIISYIPKPIYGTKYRCMDCAHEFK